MLLLCLSSVPGRGTEILPMRGGQKREGKKERRMFSRELHLKKRRLGKSGLVGN